jgi:NADH-quinone oxidoreductase subunit L
LIGTPLFSGFYSKDSIIEAVHASALPGAGFAYFAVVAGVFITAFYSFRMYFLVFHGKENFRHKPFSGEHDDHAHDEHGHAHEPHESPAVVWVPLVLLAIPSVLIGYFTIQPMLHGDFFKGVITVDASQHAAMKTIGEHFHGAGAMALHSLQTLPLWLAAAGVAVAYFFYMVKPEIPAAIKARFGFLYNVLENKYYFDWFNENVLSRAARLLGTGLWKGGDQGLIDGFLINGSAKRIGDLAGAMRRVQTGLLHRYALVMALGVFALLTWQLWPYVSPALGFAAR